MNRFSFFIKRPVLTTIISLIIVIIGLISVFRLPIRLLPNIQQPAITISTSYAGASPALVEKEITTPIENAIAGVSGIVSMRSNSRLGSSSVFLKVKNGADMNALVSEVRQRISRIQNWLPEQADASTVSKVETGGNPAIIVSFNSKTRNPTAITDYLNRYVKPELEEVDGVGQVFYFGSRDYAVNITLNPQAMVAHGISVTNIDEALKSQTVDLPSGEIDSLNRNYTVITDAAYKQPEDLKNLIIGHKDGVSVHLGDVANVVVKEKTVDSALRVNGKTSVAVGVLVQAEANPLTVVKDVKKELQKIETNLPGDFHVTTVFDSSTFIKASLNEVYHTIFEAILFVALVICLFLGNIRAAMIPLATVPICIIGVFWPMYLMGYSLNTLSLLALVLAIGLVVDDAIVVLENVHRLRQQGMKPWQAASIGTRQICFAVIAMTLTLVAVYAPLKFVPGFLGQLYWQFGSTLAFTVVISGFVALTLTPMMCARMLGDHKPSKFQTKVEHVLDKIQLTYKHSLATVLNHRRWVVVSLVVLLGAGVALLHSLPGALAPKEDEGYIMAMVKTPGNANFHYTDKYARKVEEIYKNIPGVADFMVAVGYPTGNNSFSMVHLKPLKERKQTQQQITNELNGAFMQVPGMQAFAVSPNPLGRNHASRHGFSMVIMTSSSYDTLMHVIKDIEKDLKQYKGLTQVSDDLELNSQQFRLHIDRDLAAQLDVNTADIATTLSTMMGQSRPIRFAYDGQNYDVLLQMPKKMRSDWTALDHIYVRNLVGKMIPLKSLVTINNQLAASSLSHYDRMRAARIEGEIAPGYSMGQVIKYVQKYMATHLPETAKYQFAGKAKDYMESSGNTQIVFLLSLLFIYLVMAAQFESFVDPFAILFGVFLSFIGALFSTWLARGSINLYTSIGMVTLIGLISKHGILIVDFARQAWVEGVTKTEAILEAATLRLRPILMTTAAMVLGALPLALASGPGSESRQAIGWVIVGGMLFGTFFSLYVVPVMFSLMARARKPQAEQLSDDTKSSDANLPSEPTEAKA